MREAFWAATRTCGLRVTIDSRIRGRDRDLDLGCQAENRFIVPPHLSVVEVKVNERVPYWLTELIARHNLSLIRVSKYCQSVEAFGRAPRSIFHLRRLRRRRGGLAVQCSSRIHSPGLKT